MEFHWPTAGITVGVMIVIIVMFAVIYYMLTHFTTAQGWLFPDDDAEYKMQKDIKNAKESHVIARDVADDKKYKLYTKFIADSRRYPNSREMATIENDVNHEWRKTLLYEFAKRGITVDSSDGVSVPGLD
ncbi:hypothetical protein EXVG_00292 [Emiliania huxleyi virus 202]|nr:hypothetical protein EXVG_00292 [Emiliania huxleyi virus 202]AHA54085.1 putative membrane protein [Emiliania huxleyi virus 18]AHA55134.1 putative membrane protein [Emiliania huxleyi virus 156]